MNDELKPCPFCGGESKPLYVMSAWSVGCICGAGIDEFESEAEAIASWNTRTQAAADNAQIAALTIERGWLIETPFGPHVHWIRLQSPYPAWQKLIDDGEAPSGRGAEAGCFRFCKDSNEATRFARKEDAEHVIEALAGLLVNPKATEHEWHGPSASSMLPDAALTAERDALREVVSIFLGEDDRFQVAVGGNPNAVDKMIERARATYRGDA